MARALHSRRTLLGRDVLVAYATLAALYAVGHVQFQPLQIPWYLLVVTYDFVEAALPVLTPYYAVGFPAFLYLLAVGGAAVARWARNDGRAESNWYRAAGGVCLVVAVLSLLFAATVGGPIVSATDTPTPFLITGTTGFLFLGAGWWLLTRGRHDTDQN